MRTKPVGVDLFAGAGGLSLGFEQAGFSVMAAVEYDPIHAATHEFNFPQCATICRSVAEIGGEYIRSRSQIGNRDIDVVFGGPPCQGFSMIGKRALDDPRNSLVYHFVRIVAKPTTGLCKTVGPDSAAYNAATRNQARSQPDDCSVDAYTIKTFPCENGLCHSRQSGRR